MKTEELRKSILQLAIQGKLVEQDPTDEPASVLLERIRAEKEQLIKEKKIKRDKNESVIYRGNDGSFFERTSKQRRCIDEEIPFEIPNNWELSTLQDLCWLGDGEKIVNTNLPNLDAKYLRGKSAPTMLSQGKVVESGSKVILVDGENSGEVFDVKARGYLGSTFKILIINKSVSEEYLLLMLSFYRQLFKGQKIGAAIPHLNKKLFRESYIGIPPLAEQQRIVERLNDLEPLFAEYERLELQESELEKNFFGDLNKSILQYAIQGKLVAQDPADEPASVLLERIRAEKERLIKEKKIKRDKNESIIYRGDSGSFFERIGKEVRCIDDEIPFEIPDSWEWCRLGNVCPFGKSESKSPNEIRDNEWVLDLEDIEKETGVLLQKKRRSEMQTSSIKNVFNSGNVLYSKLRPYLNKVIIADEDGFCTSEIFPLDFGEISAKYAQILLMSPYFVNYTVQCSYGVKMPRLGTKDGEVALFPLPPLAEQQRIVEKLEQIKQIMKQ